ncbi:two-component system sensor histidine kinase NtrB [Paraburkholderia fungorum]|uniref:two-component system sensor histidine kinase NtrB n=1 Tax=Paraburkholderia fungorum TaxID=134537 RepID=UPI00402BF121
MRFRPITSGPWRLVIPLGVICFIVVVTGALLSVSQNLEHARQERQLVSDTLWAEQAVVFELQRVVEALQSLERDYALSSQSEQYFYVRAAAIMQRSPAIGRILLWQGHVDNGGPHILMSEGAAGAHSDPAASEDAIRDAALKASTLRGPGVSIFRDLQHGSHMLLAVKASADSRHQVIVASISLDQLLASTIPWWFAHQTQLSLEDFKGDVLATRDPHVIGKGVYTHRLAASFADETLYLDANSTLGAPSLIPNVLTLAVVGMSILLAWTVYALWRDLAWRTAAEKRLRSQQAFREAMEASMITGLRATDTAGIITYVNQAYCAMVGRSTEELVGTRVERSNGGGSSGHDAKVEGVAAQNAQEARLMRSDGTLIDVAIFEAPMRDATGTVSGHMASVLDVTEQKRNASLLGAQNARVNRLSRLITMGEMTSALAHEINQPLTAINSYLSAGKNLLEAASHDAEHSEAYQMLEKARYQAERAGLIIRRIRQFVHKSGPVPGPVDMTQVITELLPLIRLQAPRPDADIELDLDAACPPVIGDRVLLEQVLLNLTRNAFEAMSTWPSADQIVIVAMWRPEDDRQSVVVEVRDSGPGLGDEANADANTILSRSFVSTKADGMGLGLSVCRTALELLGSRLVYEKAASGGASFQFRLRSTSGSERTR